MRMIKMGNLKRDTKPWLDLCSEVEFLVTEGNHEKGRTLLNSHDPKKIPRKLAGLIGSLAFRMNLPLYTLKALQRIVYPENTFDVPATDSEKTVYATALIGLGALREAIEILDAINLEEEPEALLHRAGASMCDWNYAAAIPYLKKYTSSNKISAYRCLVGKVNLAAAFVATSDWISASQLIKNIRADCESNSHLLLLGNCYELEAQVELFQGRYDSALAILEKAMISLKDQGGLFSLFVQKWMVLCWCMKAQSESEKLTELQKFKALQDQALNLRHWNTLRECDFLTAIVTKDENLLKKIIMGTPSEFYRQRARKLSGTSLHAIGQYLFYIGKPKTDQSATAVFDPYKAKDDSKEALFKKPILLNLFDALTQDFYQPSTIGRLFQKIYPDEKFNPFSSPARVLQILRRLNAWFVENSWPLKVEFKKSEFKLISFDDIFLAVQRGKKVSAAKGSIFELKNIFGNDSFCVVKVAEALRVSEVTARRLLKRALMDGEIIKDRSRQGLIYLFATPKQKSKRAA